MNFATPPREGNFVQGGILRGWEFLRARTFWEGGGFLREQRKSAGLLASPVDERSRSHVIFSVLNGAGKLLTDYAPMYGSLCFG